MSNICSDYFRTLSVWNGNSIFQEIVQMVLIVLQQNSSSLSLYIFTSYYALVLKHHFALQLSWFFKHVFKRNLTCLTQLFNYFFTIVFHYVPSIFIESESICFGASTSLSPTFIEVGKYVISYNLHDMGGICKEVWLWYLLINFCFGWLQNLTSGTFGWILGQKLHCAVIVTDDDINDKKSDYRTHPLPSS